MNNNTNEADRQTATRQEGKPMSKIQEHNIRLAIIKKDIEKIKGLANSKRYHLKENAHLFMEDVIETNDINFIKQFIAITESEANLKKHWDSAATKAIYANFLELLQYLQDDLHVDFAAEVQKLSKEERLSLNSAVWDAAARGDNKIVEYAVREFDHQKTFNAAFLGAAGGGNRYLIFMRMIPEFKKFEIDNGLLNYALQEACYYGHISEVYHIIAAACAAGDCEYSLEKDEENLDAVDYVLESAILAVSQLLEKEVALSQGKPYYHEKTTLEKAEELVQIIKTYHK